MSKPRKKRKTASGGRPTRGVTKGQPNPGAAVTEAGYTAQTYRQFFDDSPIRSRSLELSRALLALGALALVLWIAVAL